MRRGASVSQLLVLSVVPRGARMTRMLSRRAETVMRWAFHHYACHSRPTAGLAGNPEPVSAGGRHSGSPIGRFAPVGDDNEELGSLAHSIEHGFEDFAERRAGDARAGGVDRLGPVVGRGQAWLDHVGAAGEFELDRLDALAGL